MPAAPAARPDAPAPRLAGRPPRLRVLMVASEMAPWVKTGGLADVIAALPEALERLGHHVTVVLPRYRLAAIGGGDRVTRAVALGRVSHEVTWHVVALSPRRRAVFVDCPALFDRDGFYGAGGRDYADNAERFGLLAAAALDFAGLDGEAPADILHAHDWHAGLVPAFQRAGRPRVPALAQAGLVFTIHNLAFQGLFPASTAAALGLDPAVLALDAAEFWGQLSFMKAGINCSDYVTTVSPSYARETLRPELGFGLDGVLRARGGRYLGILNGIDTSVWDPATDPLIPARFDASDLAGKRACKRALLDRFGLPVGDDALARPVVGLVSRLVEQKGLDLVEAAAPALMRLDATWVFLGSGEARFEAFLRDLAASHPTRVGAAIGFDEVLAHQIEAGADIFLMPSRFEPCGLNQMYSLRYGTVPVVHAVGGLDDTVRPHTARARRANGFKFREATPEALVAAVRRAVRLHAEPDEWLALVRRGMADDHSWGASAREYVRVYRRARLAARDRAHAGGPVS